MVHSVPFFNFVSSLAQVHPYSFQGSKTPLIDAMTLFLNEFNIAPDANNAGVESKVLLLTISC